MGGGRSRDRGGGVLGLRALKNGECQNEIKKKMWKERAGEREREKWVKVRVNDRVKNEGGEENPV